MFPALAETALEQPGTTNRYLYMMGTRLVHGMNDLRTGLSYEDVLLVPQRSPVDSRSDVDLSTRLTSDVELSTPLLSAPMDTVTEAETAIALARVGGFGTVHRFMSIAEQSAEVRSVVEADEPVGAAVGIAEDTIERATALVSAGVDAIVIDVAHAHLEKCIACVENVRSEFGDVPLVVGNVATPAGVRDLYSAGADCVKVGIGPGSHCTTRRVAGAGVPQLTAIDDCAATAHDVGIPVIADGGIRSSGDAVKALMAGADTVMMGSLFAGTDEAPGDVIERDGNRYKRSRGMATTAANEARSDKEADEAAPAADEGVEGFTEYKGPLEGIATEFLAGIRSGLSYCGGHTIPDAREKAAFIRVTQSGQDREGSHSDHDWETITTD